MRITKGVLLVILAVFLGVALASYQKEDVTAPWDDWGAFWQAKNLCGPIGAEVAGSLHYFFGPALSWFWPLFVVLFALMAFKDIEARRHVRRIACSLALLVVIAGITAVFGGRGAAGLTGVKTLGFLRLISGRVGSVLILAALFLVFSFLLFPGAVEALLSKLKDIRLPRLALPKPDRGDGKPKRPKQKKEKTEKEVPEIPVIVERSRELEERSGSGGLRRSPFPSFPSRREDDARFPDADEVPAPPPAAAGDMPLPELSLLDDYEARGVSYSTEDLIARSEVIEKKLGDYGLDGKIQEVRPGPVVTTFEFVPAPGVKVSQIASRADDISMALAARSIRIQAPIPGRGAVGIEVPESGAEHRLSQGASRALPRRQGRARRAPRQDGDGGAVLRRHIRYAAPAHRGRDGKREERLHQHDHLLAPVPSHAGLVPVHPRRSQASRAHRVQRYPASPPSRDHGVEARAQDPPVAHRRDGPPVQAARLRRRQEYPGFQPQGRRGGARFIPKRRSGSRGFRTT